MQEYSVKVTLPDGQVMAVTASESDTLEAVADRFKDYYEDDIILGIVNGRLRELNKKIKSDCELSFVTTADRDGRRTYRRSVVLLLQRAIYDVYGSMTQLHVMHSELDGVVDYFYGFMAPSTGMLKYFDIVPYESGFVLLFPGAHSRSVEPLVTSNKLFHTLDDSREWSKMLGIGTIGSLNDAIAAGRGQEIMLLQEALMEQKIGNLAAQIASDDKKKFVMIAGPSSSGKTSFANRLSIQLIAKGRKPHPLSLDDYYVDREFCPKNPDGSFDFECLESIDIKLFNEDMNRLLKGEAVDMPSFNFKTGKREYRGRKLTLGADDILVIEGIHGLNDRLSQLIPPEHKFKIYISALTQLNIDEHNPLSTTDERLIRRIVRDARTRGTNAMETIAMWPSVRKGERENIFPFQEQADVMFNSALVYELAVLKVYAEPLLFGIERDCPEYLEAKRLLKLLDYFLPMPADGIPNNSLLREFVGGSCFNV